MKTTGWDYERCIEWIRYSILERCSSPLRDELGDVLLRLQMEFEDADARTEEAREDAKEERHKLQVIEGFLDDHYHRLADLPGSAVLRVLDVLREQGERSASDHLSLEIMDLKMPALKERVSCLDGGR